MSLYAAYACNEGSGSTIIDYSGNGRSMTIAGSGNTWVTGHGSYALAFLGGSGAGAGADWNGGSADPALGGDVTVMCWAQSSNGATVQSFAAGLYSAAGTARLAMYSYRSLSGTAASPELTVRNGAGGGPFSIGVNGSTADASWHHIAAVYHSGGTVDLYLDGTEVVTAANVTSAIGTTVQFLGVGALLAGAGANSAVQDFRVFSTALTGTDITTYMNTPVATASGTGSAVLSLGAAAPGSSVRSGSGPAAVSLGAHSSGSAARLGAGSAAVALGASSSGASARAGSAAAVLALRALASGTSQRSGTGRVALSLAALGAPITPAAPPKATGSWWGLYNVLQERAEYAAYYRSQPLVACPNDGTPLKTGPPESPEVELYCPFDGFVYPRDYDPDIHSGM